MWKHFIEYLTMAASKDSDKDRELRYLRRDNKKEQEEAMKRMAELRAVKAQKEQLQKFVQSKEEELRKTQADLVSSYRDIQQTERKQSERTQANQLRTTPNRNPGERSLNTADQHHEIMDASSPLYGSSATHRQVPHTEDNALRKKQQIAQTRRIVYSADHNTKRKEDLRKTPDHDNTQSDYSQTIDKEFQSLDKRPIS